MKVLIVGTQYPYPKDNGKKIILSSFMEYFMEKYGRGNVDYVVIGKTGEIEPVTKVTEINKPDLLTQIQNVFLFSFVLRRKSIQEAVLFSPKIRQSIQSIINRGNYDLILYDTVRVSQLFESQSSQKKKEFIYLDDLFSIRYSKMLKTLKDYPEANMQVLGNFSAFLPGFATRLVSNQTIKKILLTFEKKAIRKREIETANRFDNVLLISQPEAEILKKMSGNKHIKSIKPVMESREVAHYEREYTGTPTFIFLGALNIPHNSLSIYRFLTLNIDELKKSIPNVKIKIVGKSPSIELQKLAEKYPDNIELTGYVEDLNVLFNKSCAMIIPLLFGSGVKLKTLEALSRGLPVITTDYGVEGIDLTEKSGCILENNLEMFVHHMKDLTEETLNTEVSNHAYDFYLKNYTKSQVYEQYDRIFSV